jgi:hypothetical membrane protein
MVGQAYVRAVRPNTNVQTGQMVRWLHARLPGLLLFVLSAGFMTVIMLAASIAPDYGYAGGAISDLGVIPETALLFNLTLLVVGALNILAGLLLYRQHGGRGRLALFTLAGIGSIGAGAFQLGTSDLHTLFALLAFLCFNLEALAASSIVRGPMRVISIVAGLVGLVFSGLMVIGDSGNTSAFGTIGHGGTERMIVYPVMIWLLAFGGYLMAGGPVSADD